MSAALILVVDDEPRGLKLASARLREAGFLVETAGSAAEAWTKAMAVRPDAILSDVVMNDVDGFRFCQRIRAERTLATVPVVLISSHFEGAADQRLAVEVGAFQLVRRSPDGEAEIAALKASLAQVAPLQTMLADDVHEDHLKANARQLVRMADKVRSAEERYRTLFDDAIDGLAVLSPEGVVLEVNARWKEILQRNPAEMVGRTVADFASPGKAEDNVAAFQRSLGQKGRQIATVVRGDGQTVFLEFFTRALTLDGKPVVLASARDVTAERNTAQALELVEDRYRSMVERIPDVIWSADASGRIGFITQNVERVLGTSVAQLASASIEEQLAAVHPDDVENVLAQFRSLRKEGDRIDLEYRRKRGDGTYLWLRNRAYTSRRPNGEIFLEGIMTDVTERRQLEEALRQAQKMEAIGLLSGGIAHDFNNVLVAILSSSSLLIDDLAEGDPRREDALEIKAAAERAAGLTRQLLTFSRRQAVDVQTVELNSLAAGLQKMLTRLIGRSIEWTFTPGPDLGNVRADPGQLEQVIMNLVVNARDAMPRGGRVTLATRNVTLGAPAAAALHGAAGEYVAFSITDTGTGMAPDTMRRLFEPFFTTKEPGKGTGLGLSTCYGIVKKAGGLIAVDSVVGRGTRFDVYLPRVGPAAEPRDAAAAPNEVATVMVIDDNELVRSVACRILTSQGLRVVPARNGHEALEAARRGTAIDLVLSDVTLGDEKGPDVVDRLKEILPNLRAVFMSGHGDHGTSHFIQKPFTPEGLARKIREVLDGA